MKKNIKFFALILLSITIFSCTNSEENTSNVELENMSFERLNIDFNDDTVLKFSKNNMNDLNGKISEINDLIYKSYEEDSNLKMVTYQIIMSDKGIEIKNFDLISPMSAKNGQWTVGDELAAWNCPKGTSQVGSNCYSQECVEGNLATAFQGMSSGQTITVTVHHGGALGGGFKVCK